MGIASLFGGGDSPDFQGAAERQTLENRPNQNTAWGSTSWSTGPDGRPVQTQSLAPGLQGLMDSAIQRQQQGIDYSQFGAMPDGSAARDQAIQGAYNQATSRLDPQFAQREQQMRSRLYNMGATEGDSGFGQAQQNFDQGRNDAYNQAMYSAIGQGTQAGQAMFNQQMASRQQGIGEQTAAMNQPLQGFNSLLSGSGALNMPSFNPAGNYLGAAQAQAGWDQQQNQNLGSLFAAGGALGGAVLGGPVGAQVGAGVGKNLA